MVLQMNLDIEVMVEDSFTIRQQIFKVDGRQVMALIQMVIIHLILCHGVMSAKVILLNV